MLQIGDFIRNHERVVRFEPDEEKVNIYFINTLSHSLGKDTLSFEAIYSPEKYYEDYKPMSISDTNPDVTYLDLVFLLTQRDLSYAYQERQKSVMEMDMVVIDAHEDF